MTRLCPHHVLASAIALVIIPTPLIGLSMPSTAPAPHVLAWASFLGPDGGIDNSTPWTSGERWQPVSGDWSQVGAALVSTRSTPDARALADIAAAGSTARVAAVVTTLGGGPVRNAGVIAASTASGDRRALVGRVTSTGALEVILVPGRPVTIATSAGGALTDGSVELTLWLSGTSVVATARPLWSREPTVVVTGTLSAAQATDLAGNTGYGVYADATTEVAFSALRVEVPA